MLRIHVGRKFRLAAFLPRTTDAGLRYLLSLTMATAPRAQARPQSGAASTPDRNKELTTVSIFARRETDTCRTSSRKLRSTSYIKSGRLGLKCGVLQRPRWFSRRTDEARNLSEKTHCAWRKECKSWGSTR